MIILVDMDGPLVQFEEKFDRLWKSRFPHLLHVPQDQREGLKMERNYPPQYQEMINELICEDYFVRDLEPTPGAKEAMEEMIKQGHHVVICTSPLRKSNTNPADKLIWVKNHFGYEFTERLNIVSDKTLMRGDILIDDNPDAGNGACIPEWRQLLFEVPHNRHCRDKFTTVNWDNWQDVLAPMKA